MERHGTPAGPLDLPQASHMVKMNVSNDDKSDLAWRNLAPAKKPGKDLHPVWVAGIDKDVIIVLSKKIGTGKPQTYPVDFYHLFLTDCRV